MQPKLSEIYYLAQAGLEVLLCQPLDAGIAVVNHQAQPQGQLFLKYCNIHFTKKVQLGDRDDSGLKSISSYSREPMLDSPVTPALGESIFMWHNSHIQTHIRHTHTCLLRDSGDWACKHPEQ